MSFVIHNILKTDDAIRDRENKGKKCLKMEIFFNNVKKANNFFS